MKKLFFIIFFIFIGCGGGENNNLKNFSKNYSNVVVNDKVIYMTLSSLVGMSDYIVGAFSKDYSSIITTLNPYEISYINCILYKDESDYLVYTCNAYQNYCDNNFNCIQVTVDNNKLLIIDKNYPTYLYEQSPYDNRKYIIGEFDYNKSLFFKQYNELKIE